LLRWLLLCCQIQKIQTLLWGNFSIPFRSTLIMHMEKFSVHILWSSWTVLIIGKSCSSHRGYHFSSRNFFSFRRSCQCCFFICVTLWDQWYCTFMLT
jgi:hypothetical protein